MQYFDAFPETVQPHRKERLGPEPFIHPSCKIKDSRVGAWTALGEGTHLVESTFGDYSYTAGNVQIIYSHIGKYCSIANSVRINPGNHPKWRVTQHHMTYRRINYGLDTEDDDAFFSWRRDHPCVIGNDVWIGHGATIMPGVTVATGAVIGSGAVVTKDVGPYEVVVGVAARVIKKRFDDRIIEKLMASEWWNWERPVLEERFKDLMDIDVFVEKYC